ncbi:hypothetical protein [Paenibacillus macerans]|uniref:hypothetical protein n=1 Tax=Paenibacillus macerans TaxID=44252 RepID=UPI002040C425|nr:hypothetical protein [Paenibacillus macerans]MCM3703791.1 hypothetical protein [Paenibacillus macerans]
MELTLEQKKAMVKQRIQQYGQILFSLEMDKTANLAIENTEEVARIENKIEEVRKAQKAVEGLI